LSINWNCHVVLERSAGDPKKNTSIPGVHMDKNKSGVLGLWYMVSSQHVNAATYNIYYVKSVDFVQQFRT